MMYWNGLAFAAAILLLLLVYKEWRRKQRVHLFGRLLASISAVNSLLFMAYPYAAADHAAKPENIIVLTDGLNRDSLQPFLQRMPTDTIFHAQGQAQWAIPAHVWRGIADWKAFAKRHAADTIHVFGNGLDNEVLSLLHPAPIVFHAPAAFSAISHIYWKQHLHSGEPLLVQGRYQNNTGKKTTIVLQAFGIAIDSFVADAFGQHDFVLQTIPLHLGAAVYTLAVKEGDNMLRAEPVPVWVEAGNPLQLLIISSSPDFENNFLKNQLSQQGYKVSVVTTTSTNRINRQFLNTPVPLPPARLTNAYLSDFDVLITDEEALRTISPAELAALRVAIAEKGTGMILKTGIQHNKNLFYKGFFPVKALRQDTSQATLLYDALTDNRYKLLIAEPLAIVLKPGTQVVLRDAQQAVYASAALYGRGKIIATTLQNTYSIALAGNQDKYRQLWWLLLTSAAKKVYPLLSVQANPFIPRVNHPVQVQLEKDTAVFRAVVFEKTTVHLRQDTVLPFQWQGQYWPVEKGWQAIPGTAMQTDAWYAYAGNDWQEMRNNERLVATSHYAAAHPVVKNLTLQRQAVGLGINLRLLMLVIFLSSCIFLWVEQKAG